MTGARSNIHKHGHPPIAELSLIEGHREGVGVLAQRPQTKICFLQFFLLFFFSFYHHHTVLEDFSVLECSGLFWVRRQCMWLCVQETRRAVKHFCSTVFKDFSAEKASRNRVACRTVLEI
jgi:hypothetical protein